MKALITINLWKGELLVANFDNEIYCQVYESEDEAVSILRKETNLLISRLQLWWKGEVTYTMSVHKNCTLHTEIEGRVIM